MQLMASVYRAVSCICVEHFTKQLFNRTLTESIPVFVPKGIKQVMVCLRALIGAKSNQCTRVLYLCLGDSGYVCMPILLGAYF